jgi:hypothetical protein
MSLLLVKERRGTSPPQKAEELSKSLSFLGGFCVVVCFAIFYRRSTHGERREIARICLRWDVEYTSGKRGAGD